MTTCTNPNSVTGGIEITTGPYNNGDKVIYQCSTGYAMSGTPYVTCSSGSFTGTYPTCNLQDTNSVTVNLTDNEDDIPSWLFYLIAALVGLIMFLILTCILVWCCQLFGGYGSGWLFGSPSSGCCACCRRNRYDPERHSEYARHQRNCKTFPRRYLYDENGRRFHYDDVGRACYYNHKHQNGKVVVAPMEEKISEEGSVTIVSEAPEKRAAKVLATWKPHANPVRNINTSTK